MSKKLFLNKVYSVCALTLFFYGCSESTSDERDIDYSTDSEITTMCPENSYWSGHEEHHKGKSACICSEGFEDIRSENTLKCEPSTTR